MYFDPVNRSMGLKAKEVVSPKKIAKFMELFLVTLHIIMGEGQNNLMGMVKNIYVLNYFITRC